VHGHRRGAHARDDRAPKAAAPGSWAKAARSLVLRRAQAPEELPYFGPLMKLPRSLVDVELAFSRVPGQPKEYVQDRMRARAADVGRWLADDDVYVFLCGHKRMEEGVLSAFADIARAMGLDWGEVVARMRREGRLHIETY
jgi:benzoyl-CoA 2,3-dioxygenase component A